MPDENPEQPASNSQPPERPPIHQEIVSMTAGGVRDPKLLKPTRGSTGDYEMDSVGKLAFLKAYWKQVKAAHNWALTQNMRDPVVFLVDCEDDVGGRLARAWLGAAAVEAQIAARKRGERPGLTVVLARPVPFEEAQTIIQFDFPYLNEIAPEQPGTHEIAVVVVGLGGAASLFIPLDKDSV